MKTKKKKKKKDIWSTVHSIYLQIHTLAGLPFYASDVFFARWKGQAQFQGYEGSLIGAGKAVFAVWYKNPNQQTHHTRAQEVTHTTSGEKEEKEKGAIVVTSSAIVAFPS